jgi:hypothetical protein
MPITLPLPLDTTAPSEQFIGLADNPDVWGADLYSLLTKGLRDADAESAFLIKRLLARPRELLQRIQQKLWRTPHLIDYRHTPNAMLDLLRWHVAFGDGQGAATRVAKGLAFDDLRRLIKIAAQFWAKRGRRGVLEDTIRVFASGIRPQIDDWFYLRALIGEVLIGVEETPGSDFWALFTPETAPTPGEDDSFFTVVRVADLGDLNRSLVEDLVDLQRQVNERIEIAYVDFLDTFLDERLGHWETIGGTPATWIEGDSSLAVPRLAGLRFLAGARERVDVPAASTWTKYFWRMVLRWEAFEADVQLRFYVDDDDNAYFVRLEPPDTVELIKLVGGTPTTLASTTSADLVTPAPRGVWINVTQDGPSDPNFFQVYIDGEIVLEHLGDTTYRDGTIEVFCESSSATEGVTLSRVEVFQDPLDIVTIGP